MLSSNPIRHACNLLLRTASVCWRFQHGPRLLQAPSAQAVSTYTSRACWFSQKPTLHHTGHIPAAPAAEAATKDLSCCSSALGRLQQLHPLSTASHRPRPCDAAAAAPGLGAGYHRNSRNKPQSAKILTAAIKRAGSPEALRQLVQQHGASFNDIHCSAACTHLADICRADRTLRQLPAVQELLKLLEQLLQPSLLKQCGARGLANIVWACGKLGCAPTVALVLPMFAGARIQEAEPQHLSNTLYAAALVGLQVPADQLRQMLAAFVGVLAVAEPQAIKDTLWAVATMGLQVPADQLQQMLTALIKQLPAAKPQHVSNTLWAVATMGLQVPVAQLQLMLASLVKQLSAGKPQDVSNTLWAVATMGLQVPADQLQQMLALLVKQLPTAKPQAISNTLWAVATMGLQVPPDQLQQMLALLVKQLPAAKPQAIKDTLWAVATMGLQVPAYQLQQMLDYFMKQLPTAKPQAISNTLWAVATMRLQVPTDQLQQMLATFVKLLPQTVPQEISNTLWAVSAMHQQLPGEQQPMSNAYIKPLLAAFMQQLQHAKPQCVSNTLLACGHLGNKPQELLSALDSNTELLQQLIAEMNEQELANTAWACGMLGYKSKQLHGALLQHAPMLLLQHGKGCGMFTVQGLCNLCWSAAVLDLQQHVSDVLQLAQACSKQWSSSAIVEAEERRQLYQVHLWLLDCKLPSVGQGLSGTLTQQHLDHCRNAWEQPRAAGFRTSKLQKSVFAALQQLPASTWQQQPVIEQRTADSAYSVDIAATTAAGVQLAIEVDGPSHFLQPDRAVNGPTQCRNRALAARGYKVISIPYWEWNALCTPQQQHDYLLAKL